MHNPESLLPHLKKHVSVTAEIPTEDLIERRKYLIGQLCNAAPCTVDMLYEYHLITSELELRHALK